MPPSAASTVCHRAGSSSTPRSRIAALVGSQTRKASASACTRPGRRSARLAAARWRSAPASVGQTPHAGQLVRAAERLGVRRAGLEQRVEQLARRHAPLARRVDQLRVHAVARGEEAVLVEHLGRVDERSWRPSPRSTSSAHEALHERGERGGVGDASSARP